MSKLDHIRAPGGRRVLFLDFDGVLHPFGPQAGEGVLGVRAVHGTGVFCWLTLLAEILKPHPDVEIVVHSSWRDVYSRQELADILEELGPRAVDVTPRADRYCSILAWLNRQNDTVSSFRILDDQVRQFPRACRAELIACPRLKGVSAPKVRKALALWLAESAKEDLNLPISPHDGL